MTTAFRHHIIHALVDDCQDRVVLAHDSALAQGQVVITRAPIRSMPWAIRTVSTVGDSDLIEMYLAIGRRLTERGLL